MRPTVLGERSALVVSVSNRAAAGVYDDTTGPRIVSALREMGFGAVTATVVPDGDPVRDALRDAVDAGVDLVLTTGGTGITSTDETPEMTRAVLTREVPGIAEAIRAYGVGKGVATAPLSRGVAGQAGATLIVNLPGSVGGVKDALAVLTPLIEHALEQVHGSDHARTEGTDEL
ncbi:MAG: MogA/MoaB family molybdenum cofactor biosynthesis protein [Nocardioidaceae bacterium]